MLSVINVLQALLFITNVVQTTINNPFVKTLQQDNIVVPVEVGSIQKQFRPMGYLVSISILI